MSSKYFFLKLFLSLAFKLSKVVILILFTLFGSLFDFIAHCFTALSISFLPYFSYKLTSPLYPGLDPSIDGATN